MAGLSPEQVEELNEVQVRTIEEEEKLSSSLASLQEEIADDPFAMIARRVREAGEALEEHDKDMAAVMVEADNLRLATLKEVLRILTRLQAVNVDFLAAGKNLHLCVHQWGKTRTTAECRNTDTTTPTG